MLMPTPPAPAPIARLLQRAGIQVNGPAPSDLQLRDAATWGRMMAQGTLGFGESYMEGQWDCERLDELVCQVLRHALVNLQSVSRAFRVAERHYDLGNDLFAAMLDSRMVYSCAYWPRAATLEQAQEHKLELIGRTPELRPGERLLDVGCGPKNYAGYFRRMRELRADEGLFLLHTIGTERTERARGSCGRSCWHRVGVRAHTVRCVEDAASAICTGAAPAQRTPARQAPEWQYRSNWRA